MALQRGGLSADAFFADPDETPEVPAEIPRHKGNDRPKIRRVDDPTKFTYYHRASKFGEVITNPFLIHRAERRQIVWGMSRYESLRMEAQAVAGLEEQADKRELERIAKEAVRAAGGSEAAAKGSALHKLRERRDRGEDLAFVGPKTWAALEAWSAMADCFTWHGSEQFVVCDRWLSAGTYDALWSPRWPMTAPDGTLIQPGERLIVDLKSGAWGANVWGATYGVQLAVYAHGVPYVHVPDEDAKDGDGGRLPWPHGVAPRQDWALIPHVPIESPEDAGPAWVNLRRGAQLAELAVAWREAQDVSDLFLPAELPAEPVAPAPERIEVVQRPAGPPFSTSDQGEAFIAGRCARCVHRTAEGEPCDDFTPALVGEWPEILHRSDATPVGVECSKFAKPSESTLIEQIVAATSAAELTALWERHADIWHEGHTGAAQVRLAELGA